MAQALIAVGDHRTAPVPAAAAHDVHRVHRKGVRGPHHPADVGVVAEVLDRHVERVSAFVDVGDDGFTGPIAVRVNNIASVTEAQQLRVVAGVVGQRPLPRPHSRTVAPLGGARRFGSGFGHPSGSVVHSAACVPVIDTVAYSNAALISPWVHSDAPTCTASREASGSTSTDAP